MARVTGIGGIFFAARDPVGLAHWYAQHLGIDPPPSDYDTPPWQQQAGPCVFAPMGADGPHVRTGWSLNLRVDDLDALVHRLRAAGIEVEVDPTSYPNGRFAELSDPEGHPLQLWEPA